MGSRELVYLSQQDVIDAAPSLGETIGIIEGVFAEHGAGRVENPPKPGVHPLPDAFIHAMPGQLTGKRQVGMKWIGGFFANAAQGLPSLSGLIVLNDAETGFPTAVMDAAYITALRTAAASGVAAKYLARPDSTTLGVVGAGLQGRYNLLALAEVLPALSHVRVFDTRSEAMDAYIAEMAGPAGVRIVPVASARDAITGADVVITATGWLDDPIFRADWLGPGQLILPIHARGWERAAIDRADKFIVDDWGQFSASMTGSGGFYESLPEPYAELGQVVTGAKAGRESADELIIDFNYGLAIHDVAVGHEVLARALADGRGTTLPQLDGQFPLAP